MNEQEIKEYKEYLLSQGFNDSEASEYMQEHEMASTPQKGSTRMQAALEGLGQGISLGYLPQLQAAAEPLTDMMFSGGRSVPDARSYVERRDANIKRNDSLRKDNPMIYGGAELAGSVLPGAMVPGGGAFKSAEGATKIARALNLAKASAVSGGAQGLLAMATNPGDVEGKVDPVQFGERLSNAPEAIAMGTIMPGAEKLLSGSAKLLSNSAKRSAFKSLGPATRDLRKAMPKGEVEKIGGTLLDEGVLGLKPQGYESLGRKAGKMGDLRGKELENYLEELSKQEIMSGGKTGVSRKEIAEQLRTELLDPNVELAGVPEKNASIEKYLQKFELGKTPDPKTPIPDESLMNLSTSEKLKRATRKQINWDRLPGADIPLDEQVNRSIYGKLRSSGEETAQALESKFSPGSSKFEDLKGSYGNLTNASKIASNKAAREAAKDFQTDAAISVLGGTAGFMGSRDQSPEDRLQSVVLGLGLGLGNKARRTYGSQYSALTKNALSKGAKAIAEKVGENPWSSRLLLNNIQTDQEE